ncbi:MAG: flavodoxin family protein [Mobilitalea sp.]
MSDYIVVLVGSSRKNGNTEILADTFIAGAFSSGNKIKKICLSEKKVLPCTDCKYCYRNDGVCILQDDMKNIYKELMKADLIVFASPVYFYGFSAQMKCCIDRLHNPIRKKFNIKYSALLSVCADEGQEVFKPMSDTYQAMIQYLGWKDIGHILIDGIEDKGTIVGHANLKDAEILGKNYHDYV